MMAPDRQPIVAFTFAITSGHRIAEIEVIGGTERLRKLRLAWCGPARAWELPTRSPHKRVRGPRGLADPLREGIEDGAIPDPLTGVYGHAVRTHRGHGLSASQ